MPRDKEIDNRKYRIGTLDVFQQFHVARKLAPLMVTVIGSIKGLGIDEILTAAKPAELSDSTTHVEKDDKVLDNILEKAAGPLSELLSTMKEEDVDYILKTCLGVVRVVESDNSTVPLYDKTFKQLRYADLTMPTMITLTVSVIQDNLGSFFPTGQPASTPPQG